MSALLPNELIWSDGELFDPWIWTPDDTCHGLYCQSYDSRPWLYKFLNRIERRECCRHTAACQTDFHEHLVQGEMSALLIDRHVSRRAHEPHTPYRFWVGISMESVDFRECPDMPWWKKIRSMSIHSRLSLEERVAAFRLEMGDEIDIDFYMHEEVEKGDWD